MMLHSGPCAALVTFDIAPYRLLSEPLASGHFYLFTLHARAVPPLLRFQGYTCQTELLCILTAVQDHPL